MEASTCVFHRGQNQLDAVAYLGNNTTSAAHERTVAGVSTASVRRFLKYRRCSAPPEMLMSTFASNGHLQELITALFKLMETRRDRMSELSGSQSEPAERIPQPWPSYLKETLTLVR